MTASPAEIKRLATMLLIHELYGAQRLHSESGGQVELQTGHDAVTEFLVLSLWAFGSGRQLFSGYGELIDQQPENLSYEDTPAQKDAVLAKVDACRPIVEEVVRRYLPVLNESGAAPLGVRKIK